MINTMIALALADFAFLIPVAAAAAGGFVAYKVGKAIVKKVKISKAKKAARQAEQEAEKAAQQEAQAAMSQETGAEQTASTAATRFAFRNGFHTTENYGKMVGASGEFATEQSEVLKLQNELEVKGKAGDKQDKKLYSKKKALGDVALQSDYVKRKSDGTYDLTSYIQVGDENYAREFKTMAKGDDTEGIPFVCTISFNEKSGKQDLRLSTPSKAVFKQGERLLLQKVVDELSMISSEQELASCFPITERCAYGEHEYERVFEDELDVFEVVSQQTQTEEYTM